MSTIVRPDGRHMRASPGSALLGMAMAMLIAAHAVAAPPASDVPGADVSAAAPARVERVRYLAAEGSTRVIVLLSRPVPYEVRILPGEAARGSERRVVVDFSNARLAEEATKPIGVEDGLLKQIRTGQFTARTARVVLDLASVTGHSISALEHPPRLVIDIAGQPVATGNAGTRPAEAERRAGEPNAKGQAPAAASAPPVVDETRGAVTAASPDTRRSETAPHEAQGSEALRRASETGASQQRPPEPGREQVARSTEPPAPGAAGSARTEGSAAASQPVTPQGAARGAPWVIVLDPGHGGADPGTRGVGDVFEKDVTLAIAKRLKRRLEAGLRARVLLTRSTDVSRSLAERTAFANANSADLFVSIHANADAVGELHGVETYTLNNSNERATIRLAKMENGPGVRTGRGDLSYILSDMVQSGKEDDSVTLAHRLHGRLLERLRAGYPGVRSLGVKKGPFYVLVGAYMPCVLVETSFLSHPVEGRRLATPAYQDTIAEGLYLGVADFLADARMAKTL